MNESESRNRNRLTAYGQLRALAIETSAIVNGKWWRWYSCWFTDVFWVLATYRLNRCFYLLTGRCWSAIRVILAPVFFFFRPWTGRHELHYEADIGSGLRVLHPALGYQISRKSVIGDNLVLTGGNAIGMNQNAKGRRPILGDNVTMGIGAIIIGPVSIGNNVRIGAGAVVVRDVDCDKTVAGVPAREL